MEYRHTTQSTIITTPDDRFDVKHRLWQGCPTIARTRTGRLYAGWYSGGGQEPSLLNYNLLVRSDDDGITWSKPLLVIQSVPEKMMQSLDIQLWMDPSGRLWVFYTQRNYNALPNWKPDHLNTWAVRCDDPDADQLQWSEPRFIGCGFLRCQPTVLSDGRIFLPAYDWTGDRYQYFVSHDNGESFQRCFAGKKVNTHFDEAMFLERQDHSILLFARSVTGYIAKCESFDGGMTWTDGENTDIPNPSSRIFLKRLRSGRVLLINNMNSKSRSAMTALLSEDDGRTFPYQLLLDCGDRGNVSYPDAVQGDDGSIYIVWDCGRTTVKEIICAKICEADILAGKLVDDSSYRYNMISKSMITQKQKDEEPLRSYLTAEQNFLRCVSEINAGKLSGVDMLQAAADDVLEKYNSLN